MEQLELFDCCVICGTTETRKITMRLHTFLQCIHCGSCRAFLPRLD